MSCPDKDLVKDEFRFAADLLNHACERGRFLLAQSTSAGKMLANDVSRLVVKHQRLWRARNREGGLAESTSRLAKMRIEYEK